MYHSEPSYLHTILDVSGGLRMNIACLKGKDLCLVVRSELDCSNLITAAVFLFLSLKPDY